MRKVIVIGQAPARIAKNPRKPWSSGPSAKRLWRWFGVSSREELVEKVDVFNASPVYPGANKKGDKLPRDKQKIRERVIRKIRRGKYNGVIVVGAFVDGLIRDWLRDRRLMTLCIPHPSGVNISANGVDDSMVRLTSTFLEIAS